MLITTKTFVSIDGVVRDPAQVQTFKVPRTRRRARSVPRVNLQLDVVIRAPRASHAVHEPTGTKQPLFTEATKHEADSANDGSAEPLRKRLGKISQRIKPQVGNVARRGLRYGLVTGCVLSTLAIMISPVLSPFFLIPAVAVGASVPLLIVAGVLIGATLEYVSRKKNLRRVAVADVVELERIYLDLKKKKAADGKLSLGDDNAAWHKVNSMLEELAGGFGRSLRLLVRHQAGQRMPCGRYQVGTIFPETIHLM